MTVKDAAQSYIDRGWQVVPLRPKSKKCISETDWRTKEYTVEDFQDDYNIGLKSYGGLIDVDCDCTEAVAMAEVFLPRTGAIYGRASRRKAHWLYRCLDIKDPLALKDLIDKKMIIEVRVNHQTMAPPSIHPDTGERIEWDTQTFEEMVVEMVLLLRSVRLAATGAFLARHYNPPGARHDWGIALAGLFRRLQITQQEATMLMEAVGNLVGDAEVRDRLDAVRSTYTISEDTPHTGGKRLEELTSKEFVATIYKIWGDEGGGVSKNKLEEMNRKHAVVHMQGGAVTIITEAQEDGKLQIRYTSRSDFSVLYPEKIQTGVTAQGKPVMSSLAEAWINHKKRRFYHGIELAPNGTGNKGYYNLWQGFSVEPKAGDWSLFRQHIRLLADGDDDLVKYILTWMAETVQHPERAIGIALAFKGGQGTGKSTFAKWFGSLFGAHFLHLDSEHRLLGQFNAHLHNAIVVLADEAVWAGGKQGLGMLKRMITETTLAIERKGVDVINAKNMLHMIIASNEDWFVPANFDNRRFAVFKVSDARQNQHEFFGAVAQQLFEQGGLAAMLYDLLNLRSTINLRDIPNTDELEQQKKHSMPAKTAWWYEQLHSGAPWVEAKLLPPDGEGEHYYEIDPEPLYTAYVTQLRMGDHRANAGFMSQVGHTIRALMPDGYPVVVQHGGKRFWIIPSLEKSRAEFDRLMRVKNKWPLDPAQKLLGDVPF